MKRSTFDGRTAVYNYGVRTRWNGVPVDLDDAAAAQLRLGHELRNTFVGLWRDYEEAKAAIWLTRPEVAECDAYVEDAERTLDGVIGLLGKDKITRRSRTPDPELAAAVKAARAAVKAHRADCKRARAEAVPALRPAFAEALETSRAREKATYADFVQTRGLYWATYNTIRASYQTASAKVASDRRAGKPATLRFSRWEGRGRLAVQLQRESGAPPRTIAAIEAGTSPWRNSLRVAVPERPERARPDERMDRIRMVSVRVGSDGREPVMLTLPVVYHRPIPDDADITGVEVIRRRVAGGHRLSVAFTVRLPAAAPPARMATAGVDIGWRAMGDGGIRVGVWSGTPHTPLVVPSHLTEAITVHPDGGEVRIPASWLGQWTKCDDLASIRGKHLEVLRGDLLAAWTEAVAEHTEVTRADLARWRSPARFAGLSSRLREDTAIPAGIRQALEEWRVHDRHLWEWQAHQSVSVALRRRDLFRNVAALLAAGFGVIVVEQAFNAEVRVRPGVEDTDDWQAERARWQARIAAPAELAASVVTTAEREGVATLRHPGAWTTRAHAACGGELPAEDIRRAVTVRCAACHVDVDQDWNAAVNLRAVRLQEVGA